MDTRLIFADSNNRDANLYPNGNSYTLHLIEPLRNVERVELVSARVPNTMYNLTNGTNVLLLNDTTQISINPGFYSVYTLATAISNATGNTPLLTYLPSEGHFLFSNNAQQFRIQIQSQELATMLGMSLGVPLQSYGANPLTDPTYTGQQIYRSTTLVDMSLNDYIFLDVDELKTPFHVDTGSLQGSSGTISGSNANRAFAPIIMDVGSACIKNFHENKDYRISVVYPEPIRSLQRLTISWVDRDGQLIDFQGWNTNAFILRVFLTPSPEPTIAPLKPVEQYEIERIVEAMKLAPPVPPTHKRKIPWVWIFLFAIISFIVWKSWPRPVQRVMA